MYFLFLHLIALITETSILIPAALRKRWGTIGSTASQISHFSKAAQLCRECLPAPWSRISRGRGSVLGSWRRLFREKRRNHYPLKSIQERNLLEGSQKDSWPQGSKIARLNHFLFLPAHWLRGPRKSFSTAVSFSTVVPAVSLLPLR